MPDDQITGRPTAKEAVTTRRATAEAGADLVSHQAEMTERLQAQTIGQFDRLTEETIRVTQDLTSRALHNIEVLIGLSKASVSGWQQAASVLNTQTQQTIEHQTRVVTEALTLRRPEELVELHSRFLTDTLQAQFRTTARLAQIAADLTRQAAQRLPSQS